MSGLTADVNKNRIWYIFSDGFYGSRILVLEWLSVLVVSLLSIWITTWAPRYWNLLTRGLSWIFSWKFQEENDARALADRREDEPDEQRNVLQDNDSPPLIRDILRRAPTADAAVTALRQHIQVLGVTATLPAITLAIIFFLAIAGAGIAVSFLVLDATTASTSLNCGAWAPNGTNNTANPMGAIMNHVESYWISCYENDAIDQECGLFIDDDLHINHSESGECPFAGDVCLPGINLTITLDTGYTNSKFIGINSRHPPVFRRRTSCAPLVSDGYYDAEFDNTTSITSIKFYYGPRIDIDRNATFAHVRSPVYELKFSPSGYEIKTVSTTLNQFKPISALESTMGDVFLAFVNSFNLQYPNKSTDPIFPATNSSSCSYNSNQTCWKNEFLRASVLGCVELAEVCSPNMDKCYNVWDPNTPSALSTVGWEGGEEAFLVMFGLKYSDFGNMLSTKHGFLLDATRRIVGNKVSQSLDYEQWKLEVRRLFSMSILRAKWEMLYAVRGTRANEPGYTNNLPPQYAGVCGKFLFQAKGYKNISFVGVLAVIILPILLSFEYSKKALIAWPLWCAFKLIRLVYSVILRGIVLALTALDRISTSLKALSQRKWYSMANVPRYHEESVTKDRPEILGLKTDGSSSDVEPATSVSKGSELKRVESVFVSEMNESNIE